MSVNPISPDAFQGGQMTDLPVFTGTLNGEELFEIVAAIAGQDLATEGVNYQITSQLLANLLATLIISNVVISDGEHSDPGDPYIVQSTDGRIYINKLTPEPTYIEFALASTYVTEPLVKDVAGTVDDLGNGITVTFTGGEEADGNATVPITSPYGGFFFRPVRSLGLWTLGSA